MKLSKTTNRVISVFCLVIFMASLVYLGVVGYQLIATYRENERLKIYIENYKNQLKDLDEEHKNEIQKLKNEYTKQIKEFEDKIKDLESKIDLQSKKRQITDEQVQQIKDLRAKGLSYRAIQNQTGWSSVTINRALNGIYD